MFLHPARRLRSRIWRLGRCGGSVLALHLLLVLLVAPALLSCGDDGGAGPDDESAVEGDVDVQGAILETRDRNVVLRVPADALIARTRISIRRLSRDRVPPALAAKGLVSDVYAFEPSGLTFRKPVRVEIYFDSDSIPPGLRPEDLTLGKLNVQGDPQELSDIQIIRAEARTGVSLQGERLGIGGAASSFSTFAVWVKD
jgi:hypothetical protein